jgi:Kef-type K+ transport system membrane component KefB
MRPIVHLFTPIFFVAVGLSLNLREVDWTSSFIWGLSFMLLLVAIVGKLASGWAAFKEPYWMRWAIGIAMIPRGEVGLIFAEVGRTYNVLNNDIYASLILVIAVTTVFAPFAMRIFYNHLPSQKS